jgi:hypothetical protein
MRLAEKDNATQHVPSKPSVQEVRKDSRQTAGASMCSMSTTNSAGYSGPVLVLRRGTTWAVARIGEHSFGSGHYMEPGAVDSHMVAMEAHCSLRNKRAELLETIIGQS